MSRLLLPRLGLALGAVAVFVLGWLAGTCFYWGFIWVVQERLLPGSAATVTGGVMSMLALLVAAEVGVAYRRAMADRKPKRERCGVCGRALEYPGGLVCLECAARIA